MKFKYCPEKNAKLIQQRSIGFEEIIEAIVNGNLIQITKHHNQHKFPHQYILHVRCLNTVYLIPYVTQENGTIFLKTLYASRKATKLVNSS